MLASCLCLAAFIRTTVAEFMDTAFRLTAL